MVLSAFKVYGGISKNKDTAEYIKTSYEDKKFKSKIVVKYINDKTFINLLNEYDKVAKISSNANDLFTIEKIVISNYKETVLQNDSNN